MNAVDTEIFARSDSYPDFKTFSGSWDEYRAIVDRISAARSATSAEIGGDEFDRLEDETSAAVTAVVEQIEAIPARTFAGLAFKVEVSQDENHMRPELIEGIMDDIVALVAAVGSAHA